MMQYPCPNKLLLTGYRSSRENGHPIDPFCLSSPNKKKHFLSPTYDRNEERNPMTEQLLENFKQDTEDWRNIENILSCIVNFVENAKRSISSIQERCIRDREEMASWARAITADAENEIKRRASELTFFISALLLIQYFHLNEKFRNVFVWLFLFPLI